MKNPIDVHNAFAKRFEDICLKGAKEGASISEDTRPILREAVVSLKACKLVARICAVTGEELPEEVITDMNAILNKFEDSCTLDCSVIQN